MDNSFRLFSFGHVLALLLILLLCVCLAFIPRLIKSGFPIRTLGRFMALLLALNELVWFGYAAVELETPLREMLPFHLCDISIIMVIAALLLPRQALFDCAYFFGFGGAMQAVLTPNLAEDFSSYGTLKFFISHGGIMAGLSYMIGVEKLRPYPKSILRAVAFGLAYLLFAGIVNAALGTNYGYLRHKPDSASLLDYLGPWPWYIGSIFGIGLIIIGILYLPFAVSDFLNRRRNPTAE